MISKGTTQCIASDLSYLNDAITYLKTDITDALRECGDEEEVKKLVKDISGNYDDGDDVYEAFMQLRGAEII